MVLFSGKVKVDRSLVLYTDLVPTFICAFSHIVIPKTFGNPTIIYWDADPVSGYLQRIYLHVRKEFMDYVLLS